MTRAKFDYPDLDVPDSPLISSTPSTSFLSEVPGSAIAENIFNDPDSWEENNDAEDPLAWLVEEIEKFKVNSAELYGAFDPAVHDKKNPGLTPPASGVQLGSGLKGINKASKVRPISIPCFFESANDDDIQDQLSKILDVSGIPHHIRPLSSALTPPSSSSSKSTNYPLNIDTSTTVASTVDSPSPVVVHPSSITMSFLGWYGIYPESDLDLRSLRQQYRNTKSMVPSPSPAPSRDTFSHPPGEHASPIPPPGLEPPSHLPRSRSPAPTPPFTPSPPPAYSPTRSPAGSRPKSESNSRSNSISRSQSPTSTSAQATSSRDSNGPTRRRRLPSVPPEASSLLSFRSSSVPPPPESLAFASQQQESPVSCLRPLSSVRSLLVGPAGPRMRVSSRRSSQDSITREPPAPLRL